MSLKPKEQDEVKNIYIYIIKEAKPHLPSPLMVGRFDSCLVQFLQVKNLDKQIDRKGRQGEMRNGKIRLIFKEKSSLHARHVAFFLHMV